MPHHPLWIAHRGASREHRENTLPAFARALELDADAIELDVHVSADGVIVVHHDPDVHDAATVLPIAATPLARLRQVDLGAGQTIPTLREVMELVGTRAELLVELKGADVAAPVIECLRHHRGAYALHSFDHAAIAHVAQLAPLVHRGLLFDAQPPNLADSATSAGARDAWLRGDLATASMIERSHAVGLRVIAWTVNDPAQAAALIERGIDGICTDDIPGVLARP